MALACSVLARMAAQYRKLDVVGVRAVATAAVRDARNQAEFLERASQALGFARRRSSPGAKRRGSFTWACRAAGRIRDQRVLIVDIGGGSAEIDRRARTAACAMPSPSRSARCGCASMFLRVRSARARRNCTACASTSRRRLRASPERFGGGLGPRHRHLRPPPRPLVCAVNRIPRARRDEADRLRAATAQVRKLYAQAQRA